MTSPPENKGFKAEVAKVLQEALASNESWLAFDDYLAELVENKQAQLLIGLKGNLTLEFLTKPYGDEPYTMPFTVETLFCPDDKISPAEAKPIIRGIDRLIEELAKRKQEILAAAGIAISAKT